MNSTPTPSGGHSRGLILTQEAVALLERELLTWWENSEERLLNKAGKAKSTPKKLSREKKAEKLGLDVKTVDKIFSRHALSKSVLQVAFKAVNLLFSIEEHCVAASLPSGNLPNVPTSCIGRETEVAEIKALLESNRLITLTGTGGVGKTRLATQVAAELNDQYADGIWYVELANIADEAHVPQVVASTLGIQETVRPPLQALATFLRDKSLLLILDNCEHLLDACATLAQRLLSSASDLRILATSRERLNVRYESLYPVVSLAVPDMERLSAQNENIVGFVLASAAVQLLVERIRMLPRHRNFTVTPQNAHRLASICHRLDGIPLAIELAAGCLSAMSLHDLEHRLGDCFRLLTNGIAVFSHHQTLQAMMDWSYNRLKPKEKALLGRTSVFAGGWTLEAAEKVCAGNEIKAGEVLPLLAELVTHVTQAHSCL